MVVADTSIWISFFNRPASVEKQVLDELLDRDEVVLVGVVLTELLQGIRSPHPTQDVTHGAFCPSIRRSHARGLGCFRRSLVDTSWKEHHHFDSRSAHRYYGDEIFLFGV